MSIGKKNIIISTILCLSITVIGVSFAYFTSKTNVSGNGSTLDAKTGDMIKVSYDAKESSMNLENAIPGTTDSKNFSIKITPTENENTVTYSIVLDINNNTFEKCSTQTINNNCIINANELTYTLSDNTGIKSSGDLTTENGKLTLLTETKTVSAETTYEYTLTLEYVNTGADQNHNTNKSFTSNIKVEFAE